MTRAAPAPRGEFVDLDGRRMHVVRAGPDGAEPLVLLEAGSFGFSADWAEVQAQLAALGVRSMTYDRAGLGLSDPGPAPRDSHAIVGDCERLLEAVGETGPFILVGHSMAGLHLHLFAGRNPAKVVGLVLVDAVTPTVAADVAVRQGAAQYQRLARLVAWPRMNVVLRALSPWGEVLQWETTVAQAAAAGPLDPKWPVVVITAGPAPMYLKPRAIQADPAWKARRGYVENVRKASHASLVGRRYADAVVRAIEFVRKDAA